MIKKVIQVQDEKSILELKEIYKQWTGLIEETLFFKVEDQVYGYCYTCEKDFHINNIELYKLLILQFHIVKSKLKTIINKKLLETPFLLCSNVISNFSIDFDGDPRISFPIELLKKLNSNYNETFIKIQESFFHELIHYYRHKIGIENFEDEILTQLGQFLYDPLSDINRDSVFLNHNKWTINSFSCNLTIKDNNTGSGKVDLNKTDYLRAWLYCLRFLISEYKKLNFQKLEAEEEIVDFLVNIHKYFGKVNEKTRFSMLSKLINLPHNELISTISNPHKIGDTINIKEFLKGKK